MAKSSGVILRTIESSFWSAPPKAHPSNIYVVSYNDGRVRSFTGAPTASDRWGSRFCYIVDTAERRVSDSFTVPTAIDAYLFTVEATATWKVTNPEAVVRANLSDGNEVVLGRIRDELWFVGRGFRPDDAAGAEAAARGALATVLDEGLTLLRSTARFTVDTNLTMAVRERDQDSHQGSLDEQRTARLRRMFEGTDDAILLHLRQHPDDTVTVLQMVAETRDRNQTAQFGLLDRMLEHGLITDADAQPLRDSLMGTNTPSATMRPITRHATPAAIAAAPPIQGRPSSPPAQVKPPAQGKKTYAVNDAPPSVPRPAAVPPAAAAESVGASPGLSGRGGEEVEVAEEEPRSGARMTTDGHDRSSASRNPSRQPGRTPMAQRTLLVLMSWCSSAAWRWPR